MKNKKIALIAMMFLIVSCASAPTTLTPLEIQSMQSREYDSGKDIVLPSVISVFQDLGYTIKSADKDTGLITAESAAESNQQLKFWLGVSNVSQTAATAFIEQIGQTTRVRLNFVTSSKKSYSYGQTDREDTPILNVEAYQNAFERIENAIFIRTSSQ